MKATYIERIFESLTSVKPKYDSVNQGGRVAMRTMLTHNYRDHGKHGEDCICTEVSLTKAWTGDEKRGMWLGHSRLDLNKLKKVPAGGSYRSLRLSSCFGYNVVYEEVENYAGGTVTTSIQPAAEYATHPYPKKKIDENIKMVSDSCKHLARNITSRADFQSSIHKISICSNYLGLEAGSFQSKINDKRFNFSFGHRMHPKETKDILNITSSLGDMDGKNIFKAKVDIKKVDELTPLLTAQKNLWDSVLRKKL